MNTIQQQWDFFNALVVPANAPDIQRIEMRRAFYAGAEAMMRIQWNIGGADVSEDAGVQILEGCRDELEGFAKQVTEGKA